MAFTADLGSVGAILDRTDHSQSGARMMRPDLMKHTDEADGVLLRLDRPDAAELERGTEGARRVWARSARDAARHDADARGIDAVQVDELPPLDMARGEHTI